MKNILLTATGSMSALAVMERYKELGFRVHACDIYDRSWNVAPAFADEFFQSLPASRGEEYLAQMLRETAERKLDYLIPLTDPEVDYLSCHKEKFAALGCTLCTPEMEVTKLLRSKDDMNRFLAEKQVCRTIPTETASRRTLPPWNFPLLLKPRSGRSSQGLAVVNQPGEYFETVALRDDYLVQPYLSGDVWCVDVVRDTHGNVLALARKEILRNRSGLGMTVEVVPGHPLEKVCADIANASGFVGAVNIEFIHHDGEYWFLEVNPRFSGGVGFSITAGAPFADYMLLCHSGGALPEKYSAKHCVLARETRVALTKEMMQ